MNSISYSKDFKHIELTYRYVGDKLQSKGDLIGFELLINGTWTPTSDVKISDINKVVIISKNKIDGIRYNYAADASFPENVSLMSSSGLPAIAYIDNLTE